MTSRRDFMFQMGAGAASMLMLRLVPGCEYIDVESKVVGERVRFITPAEDGEWYWQSGQGIEKSDAPDIGREEWSLDLESDTGDTQSLEFSDLQSMAEDGDEMTYIKTMRCVFGTSIGTLTDSLVSTGVFTGIPLHRVLESLDISDNASKLRTFGVDGFESNIPMDRALQPSGLGDPDSDAPLPPMLAYEINGRPISRLRGGPVRLVIPEMWGYKNMKWLNRLVATEDDSFFGTYETERFAGTEEQGLIDDPGNIALMSVISRPTIRMAEVEGPDVTIAGASFAGSTNITDIEMSLDDGPFESLNLPDRGEVAETLDPTTRAAFEQSEQFQTGPWPPANVWATWAKAFPGLSNGEHTVTIRATDASGRTQPRQSDQELVTSSRVRLQFRVT
jgi:DMSO/TMAO reductase YedYZ molybdopterin-dependent catalytic subunit